MKEHLKSSLKYTTENIKVLFNITEMSSICTIPTKNLIEKEPQMNLREKLLYSPSPKKAPKRKR